MKVCVCVDENGGRTFLGKRQSRDARLISDLCAYARGARLLAHPYSAPLFGAGEAVFLEDYLMCAQETDVCFCEREALLPYKEKITELVVYRWGRRYPFDTVLDFEPEEAGFVLKMRTEFEGKSHECIVREVYGK